MPANAGIQNLLKILDPGFRRDNGKSEFPTFYIAVNNYLIRRLMDFGNKHASCKWNKEWVKMEECRPLRW